MQEPLSAPERAGALGRRVWYRARATSGALVRLWVPDDRSWERVGADPCDADTGPLWWQDTAHAGPCAPYCPCGPRELDEILTLVDGPAREAALAAHVEVLQAVGAHLEAAVAVLAGVDDVTPVCPGCLLDGLAHVDALDDDWSRRAEELAWALCRFEHRIGIGTTRPDPGP